MLIRILFFLILISFCLKAHSQDTLPFKIHSSKQLSEERLAKKKEGWFLTGMPRLGYDPIQGVTVGGDAELFFNATKADPFFNWTPYRLKTTVKALFTQNGKVGAGINFDAPYFLNSKWRTRMRFEFADNPNKPYFGIGESALQRLSYTNPFTGITTENMHFDAYSDSLRRLRPGVAAFGEDPNSLYTDRRYHWIHYRKFALDLLAERTYLDGNLRVVGGIGFTHLTYNHYDFREVSGATDLDGNSINAINGQTQITQDYLESIHGDGSDFWSQNNISGYDGGFLPKLKAGFIYDTRDFEPDPSKGTLLEYSFGYSPSWLGSDFNYVRNQFQVMQFIPVLSFLPNKNVLAARFMMSTIQGSDVFFREVFDIWSASQGRLGVLGGEDALRGYKKFRFGGMIYGIANIELRSHLFSTTIKKQDFDFSIVPFLDAGRVWDHFQNMSLKGVLFSPGGGLRIAWNQSTVLRLDYAVSKEDSQFFFVFGHIF